MQIIYEKVVYNEKKDTKRYTRQSIKTDFRKSREILLRKFKINDPSAQHHIRYHSA